MSEPLKKISQADVLETYEVGSKQSDPGLAGAAATGILFRIVIEHLNAAVDRINDQQSITDELKALDDLLARLEGPQAPTDAIPMIRDYIKGRIQRQQ